MAVLDLRSCSFVMTGSDAVREQRSTWKHNGERIREQELGAEQLTLKMEVGIDGVVEVSE